MSYAELKKSAQQRKAELEHFGMPGSFSVDPQVLLNLIADAQRYEWLCDGNGYFMEEEMICGHGNEKARADAAIDSAIENGCRP